MRFISFFIFFQFMSFFASAQSTIIVNVEHPELVEQCQRVWNFRKEVTSLRSRVSQIQEQITNCVRDGCSIQDDLRKELIEISNQLEFLQPAIDALEVTPIHQNLDASIKHPALRIILGDAQYSFMPSVYSLVNDPTDRYSEPNSRFVKIQSKIPVSIREEEGNRVDFLKRRFPQFVDRIEKDLDFENASPTIVGHPDNLIVASRFNLPKRLPLSLSVYGTLGAVCTIANEDSTPFFEIELESTNPVDHRTKVAITINHHGKINTSFERIDIGINRYFSEFASSFFSPAPPIGIASSNSGPKCHDFSVNREVREEAEADTQQQVKNAILKIRAKISSKFENWPSTTEILQKSEFYIMPISTPNNYAAFRWRIRLDEEIKVDLFFNGPRISNLQQVLLNGGSIYTRCESLPPESREGHVFNGLGSHGNLEYWTRVF